MSIVYIVLPLALLIVSCAVVAFLWAARHGQFDDLETPALRMLHDEFVIPAPRNRSELEIDATGPRMKSAVPLRSEGATSPAAD